MVLARVANFFNLNPGANLVDDGQRGPKITMDGILPQKGGGAAVKEEVDEDAARPPYIHVCTVMDIECAIAD
jgi:hypothetical protein